MKKHTLGRAAGFVAAIGATAALVAGGVSMTGAYFQDTESGTMAATTGEVDVSVAAATPLTSTFADLMPDGPAQTNSYDLKNTGTAPVDLYVDTKSWTIGGATPTPRATQRVGASISNGIIQLLGNPNTSYGWDDVAIQIGEGDTISFEWKPLNNEVCSDLDDAPRMYVRGGALNTWNANPAVVDRCGTDIGNGWRKVVATADATITDGPAGKVALVNESADDRGFRIRNVLIGSTSLTSDDPVALCTDASHWNLEAQVSGPNGNSGWFRVCDAGHTPVRIATGVPTNASRTAVVSLRLNAAAQNDMANKATSADLVVIATQPNAAPTDQDDQVGNDDA